MHARLAILAALTCFASDGALAVVYGSDDRREPYQVSSPAIDQLIAASALLIESGRLVPSPGGGFDLDPFAYGTLSDHVESTLGLPLCASEPYRDQPTPGWCSGVLVDSDKIVTAGHCVQATACTDFSYVFRFVYPAPNPLPPTHFEADQVYRCDQIIASASTSTEDWAVIRLSRDVTGIAPLPIRMAGAVETDLAVVGLVAAGHPFGIPLKLGGGSVPLPGSSLGGGSVKDTQPHYFESNIDVYAGNSGSAVMSFDGSGNVLFVEGVLVRGNPDWVLAGGCYQSAVCSDEAGCTGPLGSGWAEATRTTVFAPVIFPSVPALPGVAAGVVSGVLLAAGAWAARRNRGPAAHKVRAPAPPGSR